MKLPLLALTCVTGCLSLLAKTSPDTIPNEVTQFVRQGHWRDAEAATRVFLQAHPNSADAHFTLGYILFSQAKAKESLVEYTRGARYRTPTAYDLKVVASDYVVLGDFTDADKWFSKVVEWTPGDVQAWYDLARTKYNENRFEEAIETFQKTLALDPANVKAQDNLGLSYAAIGQTGPALAAYQQAIHLQENSPVKDVGPYLDIGSLLLDTNRTGEAVPMLRQALAIAPDDFRVHRELGKAYAHLDQLTKAQAELERAVQLSPKIAALHFMLAQVYRKQGLADKAKAESDLYAQLN